MSDWSAQGNTFGELPPLSVYVHVPWCVRKCPYCDFNSHASGTGEIPEAAFLRRLNEDIAQDAPLAQGRPIESIFFGGGTPSLLSASAVSEILEDLDQQIGISGNAEITLEANPGTFEAKRFSGFRQAGVNRLSIGVQSFHDRQLKALGRIHSASEAEKAFGIARQAGFNNINLDLMHGLPDQTVENAMADLEKALALEPEHLSWYQLTIETNTEFYNRPPEIPHDETLWEIQQQGMQRLKQGGFEQYEVSAYARSGQQCRHNLNYWQYGDYLGVGPGAHGKYSLSGQAPDIRRTRKTRLPDNYLNLNKPLVRLEETVELADRPFDYFMNCLRLRMPVNLRHFELRTGLDITGIEHTLKHLLEQGWIQRDNDFIATTDSGYLYLNDVLACWLE